MMADTKTTRAGINSLRHHIDKFADPGPDQAIRKNLFFAEKYLTGQSAHSRSNLVQVWLAAISPEQTLGAPHGLFGKAGSSPKTASTENRNGREVMDGVFDQIKSTEQRGP